MDSKIRFFLQACFLTFLATQTFALENENRWDGFYAGAGIGGVLNNIKMHTTVAPGGTYFDYT